MTNILPAWVVEELAKRVYICLSGCPGQNDVWENSSMEPLNPKKNGPGDVDESSDAYDTIDWLIKNIPNNTGKLGMWGISYPGFYAASAMIDAHPALKAVSPRAYSRLVHRTLHNGGFYRSFVAFLQLRTASPQTYKKSF
jgi:predicted acyl esterase